jgi:hypothetical protein
MDIKDLIGRYNLIDLSMNPIDVNSLKKALSGVQYVLKGLESGTLYTVLDKAQKESLKSMIGFIPGVLDNDIINKKLVQGAEWGLMRIFRIILKA